ncbi:DNA-dependent metalloprotease dvc-1-like [Palaemon carinicauda]|uniref:DNA-dependent metalloprotease dvc-1-like n=1 Tax=Palaemon carinicauda TaxID=392227 RepID=UPI0035B637C7
MENLEIDLSLALQMQAQFEEELRVSLLKEEEEQSKLIILHQSSPGKKKNGLRDGEEPPQEKLSVSLVDPCWDLIDPNPDIHTLFLTFNNQFFWGRLSGIEVKWSPRMTLCAGVCCYERRGGLCSVRLSLPLLKLRPRKDLVETLLHEMIHAYLFVTANNRDRDGHGPEFHKHMYRINGVAGTKISVYHSFHDEVDVYRQHIWQCNGPCRQRRPYFGLVKRAMNRAPGPRDPWWQQHQQSCGGTYTKIQEPDGYGIKKKKNGLVAGKETAKNNDIRKFFGGKGKSLTNGSVSTGKKRSKDESNPHMKENKPSYGGKPLNVGNLDIENNRGNASSSKMNNIHGFGSTGTGTVKHVNVNNASRSQVHGFSGNSPVKKKPRVSAGSGSNVSTGPPRPGMGLAVKSGSSSKTITVKGKTVSKAQSEAESAKPPSQTTFQGQGHALGGGSGVSRLLSLYSSSSPSGGSKAHPSNTSQKDDEQVNKKSSEKSFRSQAQNIMGKCPVCNKDIPETVLNKHINDCIGEFDDDDDMDEWDTSTPNVNGAVGGSMKKMDRISISSDDSDDLFTGIRNTQTTSSKNIKEMDQISVSSDDSDDIFTSCEKGPATSSKRLPTESSGSDETFPCPVCGDHFTQALMNEHLDTHF